MKAGNRWAGVEFLEDMGMWDLADELRNELEARDRELHRIALEEFEALQKSRRRKNRKRNETT